MTGKVVPLSTSTDGKVPAVEVCKEMYTETAHRLIGYNGKCAYIHGHSYKWEIYVNGGIAQDGMMLDFGDLKAMLQRTIESFFDHTLVLSEADPLFQLLFNEPLNSPLLRAFGNTKSFNWSGIRSVSGNPTAENFAWLAVRMLKAEIAKYNSGLTKLVSRNQALLTPVALTKVVVHETATTKAIVTLT